MKLDKSKEFTSNLMILYLLLPLLLLIELLLFKTTFSVNYQPYYPRAYDQSAFLQSAYETYYSVNDYGVIETIRQISVLQPQLFKGPVLQNIMVAFMFLFGPNRLSAAYTNFLFFVIGQFILFVYFRDRINTYSGIIAVGLFFFSITHYYWAGGIMDLRLDYAGMVIFGITFLAYNRMIESPSKVSLFWAFIATIITLATRSITGVYAFLIVILLCISFWLNLKFRFFKQIDTTQLRHFAYLLMLFVAVSAIAFILAGESAINYYGGMFHGSERAIRAAESGTTTMLKNVLFYPKSAVIHFVYYVGWVILIFLFQGWKKTFHWGVHIQDSNPASFDLRLYLFLFLVTVLSVWLLLLAYAQSPLVIGVLTIPIVFILTQIISRQIEQVSEIIKRVVSGMVIVAGFLFYASNMIFPRYLSLPALIEAREINVLYHDVQDMLRDRNTPLKLYLMINHEAFVSSNLNIYLYEHDGRLDTPLLSSNFPGIFPVAETDIINTINQYDVVVAPLYFPPVTGFEYPFTQSLRRYENSWRRKLDMEFVLKRDYKFSLWNAGLYFRTCQVTNFQIPYTLESDGVSPFFWLGNNKAQISLTNYSNKPLNSHFTAMGYPGPSHANLEERNLNYEVNGTIQNLIFSDTQGWKIDVPITLQPGDTILSLSGVDIADINLNPNGDTRQLLLKITDMKISCK